jgi:hypothetical protein
LIARFTIWSLGDDIAQLRAMAPFSLLAEVAPARPAAERGDDRPTAGPTYRNASSKDGFPTLDGVTTLHELFRCARLPPGCRCSSMAGLAAAGGR